MKARIAALVLAAGKSVERIWYRQKGIDEGLANFGLGDEQHNDEPELEKELLGSYSQLKPEELLQTKKNVEALAIRLLESKKCWKAVEAVAHTSLEKMKQGLEMIDLLDGQKLIEDAFAQGASNG